MRTIQDMVQQEVLCCMSSIVSTLAGGYGASIRTGSSESSRNMESLCEQAFELACPIPDYEEAAHDKGWRLNDSADCFIKKSPGGFEADDDFAGDDWQELCDYARIEPYDREVFEHWAVTDWFADKLEAHGEKVDKDFGNLCIWARTTTGQGIASDGVVERIYAEMMQPVEA